MDFKNILRKIGEYLKTFWAWLKPYLSRFHQWRKRIWKKYQINKIILLLGLSVVLVTSIYLFYLAKTQNVGMLKDGLEMRTVIYDKNDQEAGMFHGQKGTVVTLDQVSPHVVDALISTEDRRFYTHKGYDIKGILRAVVGRVTTGRIAGGGSTITQQLAKNAYLTLDQTLTRKARELFLSIEIEKKYSKDEILEMYLNNVYMANGVWGIEDASHRYFAKPASDLTKDEAAVLVGMLKGPEIYNPIDHYDNAIARRDIVFDSMVANGKMDEAEAAQLKQEPLYISDNYQVSTDSYRYPYYFDEVLREAESKAKISPEDLQNKGYKVYTYLDQNYQQGMDTSFQNDYLFPSNAPSDNAMVQGASIAINPKTGGVEAVVGGRGEKTILGLNRATQSRLSPGSTMKPLAVYTPALEAGYTADSILKDEKLSYYDVENYDKIYRGDVPLHTALEQSLNASAVWLFHEVGIDTGAKKVEKFGIDLVKEDYYHGLALGGMTKGTSPMKMANAYAVFANNGQQIPARFIRKIEDASGAIVYENENPRAKSVTSKKIANDMTSMLQGVFTNGTGVSAQPYGYSMAGKTGTTENIAAAGGSKDQWIIGYTPDVVIATWMGFDESGPDHYLTGSSGQILSQLFKDQTERILPNSPGTQFEVDNVNNESEGLLSESDLEDLENQLKEGADYWGDKIKEGAGKVRDKLSNWWNSVKDNW